MLKVKTKEELEKLIESSMKEAYSEGDYLRSYNLLKLLNKVNPENKLVPYYATLLTPSLLKKARRRWVGYSVVRDLFLKPKIYIYLGIFILLNKLR